VDDFLYPKAIKRPGAAHPAQQG